MNWLTALLRRPSIGWWDLVDILVVSFLLYEVLKLIRGTRAVQMALGGGVLVALYYGSRWEHLETVNWLIRNLFGYLVFAVIVLFQSDIRRALAHLGRAPFFRYFAKARVGRRVDRRARSSRRTCSRRRELVRSSRSSVRLACATTSRAAFPSTRS